MEPIPFEKTSIDEAKAVFDQGVGKQVELPPEPVVDWATQRKPQQPSDQKLLNHAIAWLTKLPREVRPMQLAVQFPHIVNKLADVWKRVGACEEYFDELLIIKRGNRRGFPLKVLSELNALRAYKIDEVQKIHEQTTQKPKV